MLVRDSGSKVVVFRILISHPGFDCGSTVDCVTEISAAAISICFSR